MGSRGSGYKGEGYVRGGVPKGLTAEDLYFAIYRNDDGHGWELWELDEGDTLTVGYDENGTPYAVDKNGNPTKRLESDPGDELEMISDGMSLSDAKTKLGASAEQAQAEFNEDPWNFIDDNPDNHKKGKW